MTDPCEKLLRNALRRKEPPPGFAARVEARVKHRQRLWWSAWFGRVQRQWAAVVVLLFAVLGGAYVQRVREHRRVDGEVAKQRVMLALQIAGAKVRLAQTMVHQLNEQSPGRKQ